MIKIKNKISLLLIFFFIHLLNFTNADQRFKDDQMMKSHHKQKYIGKQNQMITVHLIPHSHDDVGWLKTVDDYYYGGDMRTQYAGVQYTIDTVVDQLSKNETYKFSIVQIAFLYRWWNQATEVQRNQMRELIKNKQLEIINGGWCMSDQAAPYYEDVVDQMTIGHRWLKETLGVTPSIAWHIDPFGHQASSASMFSRMGLQAFFFARIHYLDKTLRLNEKKMQMVWHPTQYNGDKSNYIFTHVNYYHYNAPPDFCFDVRCTDQPIKDDPNLEGYNVGQRSDLFVAYFKAMAMHYKTTNLLHTLGSDFHYIDSHMWYKNIDKLIKFINQRSTLFGMRIQYSTPSDYIQAIQKQSMRYPTKTDDFFPYADFEFAYWSGYFTSRTALKGFVRQFGRWIQALRKNIAELKISNFSTYVSQNGDQIEKAIWELEMAQGILQHHDAVSGTSKQKVANDYIRTALRAIKKARSVYSKIKAQQINKQIGQSIEPQSLYFNIFWNQTAKITGLADILSNNQTAIINLYNPGSKGTYQIKLNVPSLNLKLIDANNQPITGDVICPNTINNPQNCELIFNLQFQESSNNYVKIMQSTVQDATAKIVELQQFRILDKTKNFSITSNVSLVLDRTTFQFNLLMGTVSQKFFVVYNYYESYQGVGQKSGAYIFRPANQIPKVYSNYKKIYYLEGTQSLVIVMERYFTLTKLYFSKKAGYVQSYGVHLQTFLTSINVDDGIGKEVTLNIKTAYKNNREFYTDSNGLEEQKRTLRSEPGVAGNYYPINSHIRMQDSKTKKNITLLTDRSVGGSVYNQGQIQVMVHRRLLHDDARGVGQNLNEKQVINNQTVGLTQSLRHWLIFGNKFRQLQKNKDQKIMISLSKSSSNTFTKNQIKAPALKVPKNVKLYLRPFTDSSYLMRLHNFDTIASVDVTIPDGWVATQLTLSGNQLWADWKKNQYKWNEQAVTEQGIMQKIRAYWSQLTNYFYQLLVPRAQQKIQESSVQESKISLKPFDLKTYKLVRA